MSESKSSASYSGNHSASGSDEEVGPNDFDVLLGRGKSNKNNAGNIKFHALIQTNRDRYFQAKSPIDKRAITIEIVESVRQRGRFLKSDRGGSWIEVPEEVARQKVAHAIQYRRRCLLKEGNGSDDPPLITVTVPVPLIDRSDSIEHHSCESRKKAKGLLRCSPRSRFTASSAFVEGDQNEDHHVPRQKAKRLQKAKGETRSWFRPSSSTEIVSSQAGAGKSDPNERPHGFLRSESMASCFAAMREPSPAQVTSSAASTENQEHQPPVDPLDCSGLHSLADLLSFMEGQETDAPFPDPTLPLTQLATSSSAELNHALFAAQPYSSYQADLQTLARVAAYPPEDLDDLSTTGCTMTPQYDGNDDDDDDDDDDE